VTQLLLSGCSAAEGSSGVLPSPPTLGIGLAWLGRAVHPAHAHQPHRPAHAGSLSDALKVWHGVAATAVAPWARRTRVRLPKADNIHASLSEAAPRRDRVDQASDSGCSL
jgi:hypothetical protein